MFREAAELGLEAGKRIIMRMEAYEEEEERPEIENEGLEGYPVDRSACEKYAVSCPLNTWNQVLIQRRQDIPSSPF
jgi:hypothetical protein